MPTTGRRTAPDGEGSSITLPTVRRRRVAKFSDASTPCPAAASAVHLGRISGHGLERRAGLELFQFAGHEQHGLALEVDAGRPHPDHLLDPGDRLELEASSCPEAIIVIGERWRGRDEEIGIQRRAHPVDDRV